MTKRRTLEQWQTLFDKYQASGLTQAKFCQQNELCAKYFSLRWRQSIDGKQPKSRFIHVQPPQSEPSADVSLHYQGMVIRFARADAVFITDMVKGLA